MSNTVKKGNEVPTIDVAAVTLTVGTVELLLKTATEVAVETVIETQDAVKNIVKGVLIAQKPATTTLTGMALTITDNVFNAELVKILQGGTIKYWTTSEKTASGDVDLGFGIASYTPPLLGAASAGDIFVLNTYSAIYNAAGLITGYEKISYPNCQGQPVAFSTVDNTFRTPSYTINSAPETGEAPYEIEYVTALPTVTATP